MGMNQSQSQSGIGVGGFDPQREKLEGKAGTAEVGPQEGAGKHSQETILTK